MLPAKLLSGYAAARSMTEAAARVEIEATLAEVAAQFGSFYFGPHERTDAIQQAALYGWQALCRDPDDPDRRPYDPARPLRNFLSRHIKNRLHNWKRDTHLRPEAPCECCDPFDRPPNPCEAMRRWEKRNMAKLSLSRGGDSADWHNPADYRTEAESADLVREIDRWADSLSPLLRSDYYRMRHGSPLPKARREAIRKLVRGAFPDA